MPFDPSYLLTDKENNQAALLQNLQDDILVEPSFITLCRMLTLNEETMKNQFAFAMIDKSFENYSKHNKVNYELLALYSTGAIESFIKGLNDLYEVVCTSEELQQMLSQQLGELLTTFDEEKTSKRLFQRVNEFFDTLYSEVKNVTKH